MAQDLEKLLVSLDADIRKFENAMNRASAVTNKQMKAVEVRTAAMTKKVGLSFADVGKTFAIGFGALGSLKGIQDLVDGATRIHNALAVAGLSGTALTKVYDALYASAQRNAAPIEALATLYGRVAVVQKELGVNSEQLIAFIDNVAKALRVSGTDATQASGALMQLGQALGSGTVHAEEFNSVADAVPALMQAAAAGIKEAGGSVAQLKQLVIAGKVSSSALFEGFLAGSKLLNDRLAGSVLTVDNALTQLHNSLQDAAGRINDVSGASQSAVIYVKALADYIGTLGKTFEAIASNSSVSAFIGKLQQITSLLDTVRQYMPASLNPLGALPSTQDLDDIAGLFKESSPNRTNLQSQIDALRGMKSDPNSNTELVQQEINDKLAQLYGNHDTRFVLDAKGPAGGISLKDYPTSGKAPKTSTSGATKQDDYEQALKATNEQTTAFTQQRAALAGLNGTSADYQQKVLAVEKATELLTAAQKGGKDVGKELSDVQKLLYGDLSDLTPAAQQQALAIRQAALGYAQASDALDKFKASQDAAAQSAKDAIQFQKDLLGGALSDMRSALEDGKITWKEWGDIAVNALNKIADKLQDALLDQLFKTANPFGFLGSLFGGGPSVGAGVAPGGGLAAGGMKAPAAIMQAKLKMPDMPRMPAAQPAGGAFHVTVGFDNDDLNLKPHVVRIARTEAAVTGKAGLDQYRRGQFHRDWESHAGKRRVTGTN